SSCRRGCNTTPLSRQPALAPAGDPVLQELLGSKCSCSWVPLAMEQPPGSCKCNCLTTVCPPVNLESSCVVNPCRLALFPCQRRGSQHHRQSNPTLEAKFREHE